MRARALWLGGWIVAGLLGWTGCTDDQAGKACGREARCAPGHVCLMDRCRKLCGDQSDCGNSECCLAGVCRDCQGEAPEITAVDSDGSVDGQGGRADHHLGLSLIVTGNNLTGATVGLQAVDAGLTSYPDLPVASSASQQLVANLPVALQAGTYTLTVTNQAGADQATLTVLQGEPGRDGTEITGPEIIAKINTARTGGALLEADRLGALRPMDVATIAMLADLEAMQYTAMWLCPGILYHGQCVLKYDRSNPGANWVTAVNACTSVGGDLCTAAQYLPMRGENWQGERTLFYNQRAVWTADFSDNDASLKYTVYSDDNPGITSTYAYACCQNLTPEPYVSRTTLYRPTGSTTGGVRTTLVHNTADTTFFAAAWVCTGLGSDLCSVSQYVSLRDSGAIPAGTPVWSNDMSDNDVGAKNDPLGPTGDDPGWSNLFSYACCSWQRPLDGSCPTPGTKVAGVCVMEKHEQEDRSFFEAARACATAGADVCSKSQMQVLRNQTQFSATAKVWTNDGADNDLGVVGGLVGSQPDNPNMTTDKFGYACCL